MEGVDVKKFFAGLGPGLVTGAADDDPSGISTYSTIGATFGYAQLWMVFLTFPLMTAVQLMCARLALVTGEGFSGAISQYSSRRMLWFACVLLLVANIVNIGADLAGMAEALAMVTPIPKLLWIPLITVVIVSVLIFWNYKSLARILKWLTVVLAAYIITAFLAHPDWLAVLKSSFVPQIEFNQSYLQGLVAVLGTTITPYMFFWEASQEVEEEIAEGKTTLKSRLGASVTELRIACRDVVTGMAWAGITMFFIIVTTAATLHPKRIVVETAQQAAEALRPLAGDGAYILFTLGIVGTGLLAIPVLAGSAGYAVAEAMHWRASLNDSPKVGGKFYAVIAASILVGAGLTLLNISAVKALYYAAILNGVLAVPLVWIISRLTNSEEVMGKHKNPLWLRTLGALTVVVMGLAALAMMFTSVFG
ncbi:MAG: Nramp family divalent metal transporter [Armatimonadetes bacterium]|nr:Nramp family divalent metal transporter [Armatimonadota bacterium]